MDEDEAIMQMELLNHDFFTFKNNLFGYTNKIKILINKIINKKRGG